MQLFDIFRGEGDPLRAILGVIQFLYLNSNMSLIINPAEMSKETNPEEPFFEDYEFSVV